MKGIYYFLTLIITCATTLTGVLVLQIHFKSSEGRPAPKWLHTIATWMAVLSFSKYNIKQRRINVILNYIL